METLENGRRQIMLSPAAKVLVSFVQRAFETALRLPGLILLELWWRARMQGDDVLGVEWTKELMKNEQVSSFLEVSRILEFVHTRNFDESAAHILSYSVLFLSALFLLLPVLRLVSVYMHALSFALFGFAHYMSIRYVQLEQESGGEIVLDDFVKLERHGFHFLAQVMIGLTISCLLRIQSDLARASLAIFCAPIVARMCGFPVDRLMVAHNFATSGIMLAICFYLLNTGPALLLWIRRAYKQLRATLVVRGVAGGSMAIWRRLRIPSLLASAWVTLWCLRVYVEVSKRQKVIEPLEYPLIVLAAIAESTATPLSLFGLAVTVSYAAKFILQGARLGLIGATEGPQTHDAAAVVMQGGYTEGLTLVLLCAQTGVLGMKLAPRAFLLGLVLFIVMSALMQSLFELLEPHLLSLGASHHASRLRHVRALILATILFAGPFGMAYAIARFLPLDLWCVIIVSNCLLTSLQTLSTVIVYTLFLIETRAAEPWERLDDLIFYCKAGTRALEFLLALVVIIYGLYASFFGQWSYASAFVLLIHCYFNVWRRLQSGWRAFQLRRKAAENIQVLARASQEQLRKLRDVCAICFMDMVEEARVTPCSHFFHGACLRKWLFVKQSCPLCHADLSLGAKRRRPTSAADRDDDSEEGYSSEWESESEHHSSETEYTMASSDEGEAF
uniref:RING-type domain-containing protein n=1 Tax=Plectus sambesii TaxID=2011161 RepID=A0A914XDU2_9BILA